MVLEKRISKKRAFSLLIFAIVIKSSEMKQIKAISSEVLTVAITNAKAGDEIELLPIDYIGNFVLPKYTEGDSPITIYGTSDDDTNNSTTIYPSEGHENVPAFQVNGNNWVVQNIVLKNYDTAVVLNGNSDSLNNLVILNGINGINAFGNHAYLQNCVISGTGSGVAVNVTGDDASVLNVVTRSTYNGIIVSGQRPLLRSNVIKATKTLTVGQGVSSGTLKSNVCNGPTSFGGNGFNIISNVLNQGSVITGSNNSFKSNVANGGIKITGTGNHFSANIFNKLYFDNEDFYDDGGNIFNYARGSKRPPQPSYNFW